MKTIHYILVCCLLTACMTDTLEKEKLSTVSTDTISEIQDETPKALIKGFTEAF